MVHRGLLGKGCEEGCKWGWGFMGERLMRGEDVVTTKPEAPPVHFHATETCTVRPDRSIDGEKTAS